MGVTIYKNRVAFVQIIPKLLELLRAVKKTVIVLNVFYIINEYSVIFWLILGFRYCVSCLNVFNHLAGASKILKNIGFLIKVHTGSSYTCIRVCLPRDP